MTMRRRIIDTEPSARALRARFMDRPASRKRSYQWSWPDELRHVGSCESVMYSSDKWRKPKSFVDYKHVSEGPQSLYTIPGFIHDEHGPMRVPGETIRLGGELPDSIALLAPILGIQARLHQRRGSSYYLPNGDAGLYELFIPRAKLGAIDGEGYTVLVVYTESEGILCVISGDELAVEKDGIVG